MDTERYEQSLDEQPTISPWARFNLVVTSLELLQRTEQYRKEAGDPSRALGPRDHRRGPPPQGREGLRGRAGAGEELPGGCCCSPPRRCSSIPAEYQALLSLIDPLDRAHRRRSSRRASRGRKSSRKAVRALMVGQVDQELGEGARQDASPTTRRCRRSRTPTRCSLHLAETYSLSDRLIRNRRAVVGGFSERKLHVHPVGLLAGRARGARRGAGPAGRRTARCGAPRWPTWCGASSRRPRPSSPRCGATRPWRA